MVVDDHDPDPVAHGVGTSATIVVPAPSLDSIFSTPPISASRSRMPRSPRPSPFPPPPAIPRPSSSITTLTELGPCARTTLTERASAWRATFVSASCTIR